MGTFGSTELDNWLEQRGLAMGNIIGLLDAPEGVMTQTLPYPAPLEVGVVVEPALKKKRGRKLWPAEDPEYELVPRKEIKLYLSELWVDWSEKDAPTVTAVYDRTRRHPQEYKKIDH